MRHNDADTIESLSDYLYTTCRQATRSFEEADKLTVIVLIILSLWNELTKAGKAAPKRYYDLEGAVGEPFSDSVQRAIFEHIDHEDISISERRVIDDILAEIAKELSGAEHGTAEQVFRTLQSRRNRFQFRHRKTLQKLENQLVLPVGTVFEFAPSSPEYLTAEAKGHVDEYYVMGEEGESEALIAALSAQMQGINSHIVEEKYLYDVELSCDTVRIGPKFQNLKGATTLPFFRAPEGKNYLEGKEVSRMANAGKAAQLLKDENSVALVEFARRDFAPITRGGSGLARTLLKKNMVKDVIIVPSGPRGDETYLLLLSYNNENVRLVDARLLFPDNVDDDEALAQAIERVVELVNGDEETNEAVTVPTQDLFEEKIPTLDPAIALFNVINKSVEDGVALEDFVDIRRGNGYVDKALDNLRADAPSGHVFVVPSDVEDGLLRDTATPINPPDLSSDLRGIIDYTVLFPRSGETSQTLLVSATGERIYPSANYFVLTVKNPEELDPAYLAAFLASRHVADLLGRFVSSSWMPSISAGQLKDLCIPLLDADEQRRIGKEYTDRLEKLREVKEALRELRQAQYDAFPSPTERKGNEPCV